MEFGFYIRQNCRFLLELKLQNALANYKTTKKELVSTAHEEKKIFLFFSFRSPVCAIIRYLFDRTTDAQQIRLI